MLAIMVIVMLVSCNSEIRNDGIAQIRLLASDTSKGITVSEGTAPITGEDSIIDKWTYTAIGAAGQLRYGEVSQETILVDGSASLNLSYGNWTFSVFGYTSSDEGLETEYQLVYYGCSEGVLVNTSGQTFTVNVDKVSASFADTLGKNVANAKLDFGEIKYKESADAQPTALTDEDGLASIDGAKISAVVSKKNADGKYEYYEEKRIFGEEEGTLSVLNGLIKSSEKLGGGIGLQQMDEAEELSIKLEPGDYKLTVTYTDSARNYSEDSIEFTAKSGQTYAVEGYLVHGSFSRVTVVLGSVYSDSNKYIKVTGTEDGEINYVSTSSPFDDDKYKINITETIENGVVTALVQISDDYDGHIEILNIDDDIIKIETLGDFTGTINGNGKTYYFKDYESDCYVKVEDNEVVSGVASGIREVDMFGRDSGDSTEDPVVKENYAGDVVIPEGVTAIGDNAFLGCEELTDVVIPSTVNSIGNSAFCNCIGLEEITIPEGVTSIGNNAFGGCGNLETIHIPASVAQIGSTGGLLCGSVIPFDCTYEEYEYIYDPEEGRDIPTYVRDICNLTSITVDNNNRFYSSIDGVLFNKDATALLKFPGAKEAEAYTVPSSVESIEAGAFVNCCNIGTVVIPGSVKCIRESAFMNSSIVSIEVPSSVEYIEQCTFLGCNELQSVILLEGLETIDDSAFEGCTNLESIIIPSSVTCIGARALSYSGLKSITIPENVCALGGGALSGCEELTEAYIHGNLENLDYTFEGSKKLSKVELPSSIAAIDGFTFLYCSELELIVFNGTSDQWYEIELNGSLNCNAGGITVHCTNEDIEY